MEFNVLRHGLPNAAAEELDRNINSATIDELTAALINALERIDALEKKLAVERMRP